MICFLFLFAIKFYPDFFHYNLSGTGSYKARLQAIAEANAKIQEELDEKKSWRRLQGNNFSAQSSSSPR